MVSKRTFTIRAASAALAAVAGAALVAEPASGQVRTKGPDRGTYRSPVLEPVEVEPIGSPAATAIQPAAHQPHGAIRSGVRPAVPMPPPDPTPLADPAHAVEPAQWQGEAIGWQDTTIGPDWGDTTCGPCSTDCDACGGAGCAAGWGGSCEPGCDSLGCDSLGGCDSMGGRGWANANLSLAAGRWFGGAELLLMFRKGDRLPPLVTTGPDDDPDTAGQLGDADTEVLFGGQRQLRDLQAGGRLTIGTWIDPVCGRSLVLRGWFAGEETDSFSADQGQFAVLTRPFLNVSDGQPAAQDTQIVAFPDRASGAISVRARSNVFGADLSARQCWYQRFGGTIDVLYGYQYMQLNEDLSIANTSVSQDDDFAPVGAVLAIDDRFDVENEFHGGQFGVASRYREGCWSFHALAKVAFGSLDRRIALDGQTVTSLDGANAVDPNGLLVRQTNAGHTSDHTFGWVPELDFTLGWQRYPCWDVTVGYNVIAMTDAIQVSGTIDPDLAVNLADPPTGDLSPSRTARYGTFYVQGIHFGLRYVY